MESQHRVIILSSILDDKDKLESLLNRPDISKDGWVVTAAYRRANGDIVLILARAGIFE